ncbi:sulfurtransferase [Tepidibacter aestuarii]|uniref:sulfurtransferase n=1 Tax=Tepidibacter aestuarii TaxID=2925782 RepID=UPI0020C0F59D|nr:sulfurtransferase [Tepidibacter aestuarii]CAH2213706.1 thiosulfate/3-mercaptopyruvate sulfurtransferase [Tepidibacter aestuarii]
MKNLVSAKWLKENNNNNDMVVVDCRFDLQNPSYGKNSYLEGHIPHAVYMDMDKDLAGEVKEHGGRHPLPDLNVFKSKLESCGIGNDTTVVAYDDGEVAGASRFWWMLKYIGHDKVYILDGGIRAWIKESYSLSSDISKKEKQFLDVNINESIIATVDEVKENIAKDTSVIIDSRSFERYKGEVEPIDKKAGHIPSAQNYFWMDVLENDKVKNNKKLKDHFNQVLKYKNVIVHCGSGITGCVNFLALDEIGIKPKLYLGSWSDWISYDENEVRIGE